MDDLKDARALDTVMRTYVPLREIKSEVVEGVPTVVGTFSGYGAVFGNVDSHGDVIMPGAFKRTLEEARERNQYPAMLLEHGGSGLNATDGLPIGSWISLSEDEVGLRVEGQLGNTVVGRDVYTLLNMPRPAITGLSIGYSVRKYALRTRPEEPRRRLFDVQLAEISVVAHPSNRRARIGDVKSDTGLSIGDAAGALRDAGFEDRAVKRILAEGFRGVERREAAPVADAAEERQRAVAAELARLNLILRS